MANFNPVRDSSAADAARISYVGHQGTGLERLAYSQAPRRGGETGVCVHQLRTEARAVYFFKFQAQDTPLLIWQFWQNQALRAI